MTKKTAAFRRLLGIMDQLREKCPWDRKQTWDSLKTNTIEETYELIDAINEKDYDGIKKELGDLLLHIVFYAKIADEEGKFDIGGVADALCDKLIFRHPHVFGEERAEDARTVVRNWEELKKRERRPDQGVLSGVPGALPALVKAYRMQEKTAAVGFDWPEKEQVWDKVKEEIGELQAEMDRGDRERAEKEFGDVLFALVNAGRLYGLNPESALEATNRKFKRRFEYIEARAAEAGKDLRDMTLEEMDACWNEAKRQ